jgi:ATP-dependent RNA/DNA helicase IGHMBP2
MFVFLRSLLETCSLARLQAKGKCLLKLRIESKYTGLYGRTIIVLQTAVPGKIINTQHFSSGDIVSISENSLPPSQINNAKVMVSGTVTKVAPQSVSIAIDNDLEDLDNQLNDNDTYKIIKLSNDITYKRIKTALVALKEQKINQRSEHLADVLFLKVRPSQCNSMELFPNMNADDLNASKLDFFNRNLDQSQQEAVKFTFQQKDLAIIHG